MIFSYITIDQLCTIEKKSISPKSGIVYSCYSLPAFDNNKTPEILDGREILSSKLIIDENTILFNKLNPKFNRIWNIHSLPSDGTIHICSSEFLPLKTRNVVDQDYLYYYISSKEFTLRMDRIRTGTSSSQQRIDWRRLLQEQIPIPSLNDQRMISSYLKCLDDRIELNNRINNNLEQQASALIEDYCASTESTVELGQILSFENGFAFQSNTYLPAGSFRIITIKNVQDGRIDSQGAAFIEQIPDRMKPGCVLSIGDVLLSLTGNVGRVGIVCEEKLLLNQRVAKLIPKDPIILPWLYYYFRLPSSKVTLESIAKGTAQQNLSPVETLKLQVPFELSTALDLSKNLQPMFNQEIAGSMESIRLAAIRDALLPKLMSGELDVSGIEL